MYRFGETLAQICDHPLADLIASGVVMVVFGACDYFADVEMAHLGINPDLHAAALAAVVGVAAGIATLIVLLARRERRRIVQDELRRLAELNHRIRNGLQVIADAHYTEADAAHRKMMMEAVASMDDSLKQLFPALGFEHRRQAQRR